MKKLLFILLVFFCVNSSYAQEALTTSLPLSVQNGDTWSAFWSKDTTLIGFKDRSGVIKIEPKFTFVSTDKFDNIIAVSEKVNNQWNHYYLTKEGRIVGRDSVYVFDNSLDCESEGFIRFRDYKNDKVGMFDKYGNITVPAEYDDLEKVRNGMIIALKHAERIRRGEYYGWTNGKNMLIDTLNNVLIESFTDDYYNQLLFSIEKNEKKITDAKGVALCHCFRILNVEMDSLSIMNKDVSLSYFIEYSTLSPTQILDIENFVEQHIDSFINIPREIGYNMIGFSCWQLYESNELDLFVKEILKGQE